MDETLKAQMERAKKEMCECGHKRIHHKDIMGLAIGHGECTVRECPCRKYTWVPTKKSRRTR